MESLFQRAAGQLLHVTSLPHESRCGWDFGSGDLGPGAYEFVKFLSRAHQRWWQVLPVGPVTPCMPVGPVEPVGPIIPCAPVGPVGPVMP